MTQRTKSIALYPIKLLFTRCRIKKAMYFFWPLFVLLLAVFFYFNPIEWWFYYLSITYLYTYSAFIIGARFISWAHNRHEEN